MIQDYLDYYYETFGENYPLTPWSNLTEEEIKADIRRRVEENDPAGGFEYESDLEY
jgi:hypothetical protein